MDSFDSLFASHFTDDHRSLTNTLAGFIDHAVRLAALVPATGSLTTALTDANTTTQDYSIKAQQAQQAVGLSVGTQKEATQQTATAQATALDRIRKNEAALKSDVLVEDPKERQRLYSLLYPTGSFSYYTTAKLSTELPDRLDEYLTRTEAESAALGPGFVQRTTADLSPFRAAREQQVAGLTGTSTARDERTSLVAALNQQCDYNYHLLSAYFREELGRPAKFWNPGYYIRSAPRTAANQLPGFVIQPLYPRELFDLADFDQPTRLLLTLPGGGPLYLALVPSTTTALPAERLLVAPQDDPQTILLSTIPGQGTHLLGYNEGPTKVTLDVVLE